MMPMSEVTRILSGIEAGDPHAAEQLLPLVYDELHKLAAQKLITFCTFLRELRFAGAGGVEVGGSGGGNLLVQRVKKEVALAHRASAPANPWTNRLHRVMRHFRPNHATDFFHHTEFCHDRLSPQPASRTLAEPSPGSD
jgi:hypothetical protein